MAAATASGVRYAPADPTLPKPWKGLVDGKTGYLYFWNPVTNVTQYEKPAAVASSPPPSPRFASSSVEVQSSPPQEENCRDCSNDYNHEEEGRYKGDDNYGSASSGAKDFQSMRNGSENPNDSADGSGKTDHTGVNDSTNVTSSQTSLSSAIAHGSNVDSAAVDAYRRQHEITVSGDDVPPPFMSFETTGFPLEILREVRSAGFTVPTPIQAQSWPIVVQNHDIVAIAKTGSGKTLGYIIPGFVHLKKRQNNSKMGPTVLVLSPTRELATQIQDQAEKFGQSARISCTCLYGGAPKGPQLKDLDRGVDIVVATPGRLNDILEMRRINLGQVSYLVLDEADRMLDMGFEPQIRKIVQQIPPRRQTLMYTATWPKEVRKIASDLLVNPVQVNIGKLDQLVANKSITQYVEVIAPMEKQRRLEQIICSQEPGSKVIVFCATKKMCDQLARSLTRQFGAAAIHGDKSQDERDHVLSQFRTGRSPVLVATDVAARGLDVKDIRVVINYDFPTGVEDYVHRIGRTGRAGATGVAYTFFGDQNAKHASDLVKILEGANQCVPPELRGMVGHSGGMGRGRRQFDSGNRDGGQGWQNESSYGGRGGGRGMGRSDGGYGGRGYDREPQERYNHSYQDGGDEGRNRSRSPNRGSGWGYTPKSWNPDN